MNGRADRCSACHRVFQAVGKVRRAELLNSSIFKIFTVLGDMPITRALLPDSRLCLLLPPPPPSIGEMYSAVRAGINAVPGMAIAIARAMSLNCRRLILNSNASHRPLQFGQ